jgi:hypothetical protein
VVGDNFFKKIKKIKFFGAITVKNDKFLSSNGRIRIQTVKFQFKRINHEPPRHYRPPWYCRELPPDPGRRQPHCPIPLPRPRGRTGAIERYWNQPKASFEAQKKFPTCFCSGSEINVSVFIETSCRLNSI